LAIVTTQAEKVVFNPPVKKLGQKRAQKNAGFLFLPPFLFFSHGSFFAPPVSFFTPPVSFFTPPVSFLEVDPSLHFEFSKTNSIFELIMINLEQKALEKYSLEGISN
jgi:hypothetical protein